MYVCKYKCEENISLFQPKIFICFVLPSFVKVQILIKDCFLVYILCDYFLTQLYTLLVQLYIANIGCIIFGEISEPIYLGYAIYIEFNTNFVKYSYLVYFNSQSSQNCRNIREHTRISSIFC